VVEPVQPPDQCSCGGQDWSGTTAPGTGSNGSPKPSGNYRATTAQQQLQYQKVSGSGAVLGWNNRSSGTTASTSGTTAGHLKPLPQKDIEDLSPRTEGYLVGAKECVRALIHPVPSDVDSLLIVRISYDQRNKSVGNSVFDLFRPEGMPNRLAPIKVYLNKLWRTIRPQVRCHHHQNPKVGNALTPVHIRISAVILLILQGKMLDLLMVLARVLGE